MSDHTPRTTAALDQTFREQRHLGATHAPLTKLCRELELEMRLLRSAAEQVSTWWGRDGQWKFGATPTCIESLRKALAPVLVDVVSTEQGRESP